MQSPWAVLLCKFSDDSSEPAQQPFYDNLFTASGIGTQNMVDFFRDVSHGSVDTSGSKVFGWYTLDQKRSDYTGSGVNPAGRDALVTWARGKASSAGVNLGGFVGVVVVMNVQTDLFGGGGRVVCDPASMEPSLLGQEMGHGYGLEHSRADGSIVPYMDPWDTMSTAAAWEAPHVLYRHIGPGLNAANMDGRGWLDGSRVRVGVGGTVQLRPIHRRDLPGWLAARVGDFYVEFRVRDGWDAGIPAPVVLVHRLEDNFSYLMRGQNGGFGLAKGDVFEAGANNPFHSWIRVEVEDIDAASETATIGLIDRPADRPPVARAAEIFGGVAVDGGGWIVLGAHVIHVPPRSPVFETLKHLAALEAAEAIGDPGTRATVKESLLAAAIDSIAKRRGEANMYSEPTRLEGGFPELERRQ